MKNIVKIAVIIGILITLIGLNTSFASTFEIPGNNSELRNVSITNPSSSNIVDNINETGFNLLRIAKTVLQGVFMIFIVYIGVQMILSMGSDEDQLGKAKRQIYYALIGLIFINIPGTLYNAFKTDTTSIGGTPGTFTDIGTSNIFADFFSFGLTVEDNIIGFIRVAILGMAVFMIVYAGIRILTSAGQEEKIKEGKNKIIWALIGLLFIGFIEGWRSFAFDLNISDGVNLFSQIANLALFFAGPIALVFLTLAGYYYITSNGDEEKTKKAKSIIINILIATVLLLASYTFLIDLSTL